MDGRQGPQRLEGDATLHPPRAVADGVRIALGTDAGVDTHGQNAREFELLVTVGGMSPMQAIEAGAMNATTLQHPVSVMKGGDVVLSPNP